MRIPGLPEGTGTLLELDLTRGLAESPPSTPLQAIRERGTPGLRATVEALHAGAEDDGVLGLVAHIGQENLSLAVAGELRTAVSAFRTSGKPAVCWTETFGEMGGGNVSYHLAAAFGEIWLQPSGDVGLTGMTAEAVFVRGALDKLGIESQIGQRHEYKSAADTFLRSTMTDPHREMATRLAESGTEIVLAAVAEGRGMTVEAVRALMDDGPLPAARALSAGLVDRIGYRADVMAALREQLGEDVSLQYAERHGKGLAGMLRSGGSSLVALPGRGSKPVVAVIHAAGPISLGRSTASPFASGPRIGSDTVGAALRAAGDDEDIKAVVLRVDSPGGSYVASDAIRREVLALRATGRPVVASMGSVAASGGYYIAMPADEVLASPGTITGSIGVLAGKQVLTEALGKIGVTRESVSTGRYAEMFSSQRPFTDEEWQRLDTWLDRVYEDFTAKAAEDRGMDVERLRAAAKGRVWTGADALEQGLVDRMGGLQDAIGVACRRAGYEREDVTVQTMPKLSLLQQLTPAESSEHPAAASASMGLPSGALDVLLQALGLPPGGVLSMPVAWHLR
ncbi:signal peptide peptidase SppA [soil metagenome]